MKVTQSCPTLCDTMDYRVHGILQARILEWVPFPSPGDLPNPGIEPRSPTLQVDSLPSEPPRKPTVRLCCVLCLVTQLCPTLCDPMDCSPPGSLVHGILQARILEWLPLPSPGDLPEPGIEPRSPKLAGNFFTTEPPGKSS